MRDFNKVSVEIWKGLYLSGMFDHLDTDDDVKIKRFYTPSKNKEISDYLKKVIDKADKKELKRLYDGYLISLGDNIWMKVLMVQETYLGFVIYKLNHVERYVTDGHSGNIIMTRYTRGNIRGVKEN